MKVGFLETIIEAHKQVNQGISNGEIKTWTLKLLVILFPTSSHDVLNDIDKVQEQFIQQKKWLVKILKSLKVLEIDSPEEICDKFFDQIPLIYEKLKEDIQGILKNDPAARTEIEIIRSYPGFFALSFHRIAHQLYKQKVPLLPRIISEISHAKTGIDLHPGAQIGRHCFIDHGTGIVIGETCIIGNQVKIYQGVTLGALSVSKKFQDKKRHPTIQDGVIIYSGATILGGQTVIGHHSIIGGNVWLTESVPPYTKAFHRPQIQISTKIAPEISSSIQQLVGNTPMVEIKTIFRHPHVRIFAKLEGQNPGGSVKDRAALNMIQQALKRGDLKPGMKVIEPTSGNTGIAIAMIASMFGLEVELVMPQNSTKERIQTMEAFGAKVILTPAEIGIQGARDFAQERAAKGGYYTLNQFGNPDNYLAHYNTTGPEIYRDTQGNLTHFVSAMGTTGTIMGTSMFMKEQNPDIQIIGVQPKDGAKIPGIRRWSPAYLPKIYNPARVDQKIDVSQPEAVAMMKRLAKQQAIFAGVSSGGAMHAAVKLAKTLEQGVIVTIVCDRGDRYLSSGVFQNPKI